MEIKNIYGAVIYTSEKETIKETLIEAIKNGANLVRANLVRAKLYGANLVRANLYGANLDGAKMPMYCKWSVTLIGDKIKIGCKEKTISEWDKWFDSSDVFDTKRDSKDFKQIEAMFLAAKAYSEHLNK